MKPPRVFLAACPAPGERVPLSPEVRRHLRALRVRPGQHLAGADPSGAEVTLVLLPTGDAAVRTEPDAAAQPGPPEAGLRITLALAIAEAGRMDWAVEKAVELGAAAIVPVSAARCPRAEVGAGRAERWRRLAEAAAVFAHRRLVPAIGSPVPLSAALEGFAGPMLICEPGAAAAVADAVALWPAEAGRAMVAIGPEGGWTAGEVSAAQAAGATCCGLGPGILRMETAALVAVTLVLEAWRRRTEESRPGGGARA